MNPQLARQAADQLEQEQRLVREGYEKLIESDVRRELADHAAPHHHGGVAERPRREIYRMHRDRDGFDHGGVLERQGLRQPVKDILGYRDVLGEGAIPAVIAAGYPQDGGCRID